ncbi:MAG TPA: VOC family protein [Gammaproteobacteria bacterium]|nr:VOC family protein [Gammaproteobacteria bacterium]
METVISDLVNRFEKGTLSRRQLIRGLTMLAATGGAVRAQAQETPFKSSGIDHISIQVTDLPRSIDFYQKIFGLSIRNEDKANEIVRMGVTKTIVSLHHKTPMGIVDHFAIAIDGFDRESATRTLQRHGLTADTNLDYGFHVRDPEGVPVQIVGT